MYYRREGRRRRYEEEDTETGRRRTVDPSKRRQNRGARFTFAGFFIIGACLAVMKVLNPELPLRTPIMMFAGVAIGCIIMSVVARRM